jgi:hypothetical protein
MLTPLAPIVVFCYNRPQHLRRTLEALRANPLAAQSTLYVYSDGASDPGNELLVREVREVLSTISGFASLEIIAGLDNRGLARSVIEGVSEVLQTHENVIVLEDDMLCTTDFLAYMNQALDTYQGRPDIFSVTGYAPPMEFPATYPHQVYLAPRASSWGWGTWRDRWQQADWQVRDFPELKRNRSLRQQLLAGGEDLWPMLVKQQRGVISSWAVRWTWTQSRQQAYGLYPVRSKIRNIGTDGSGTNFTFSTDLHGQELQEGTLLLPPTLQPDPKVLACFKNHYRLPWQVRLKNWLKYGIRPF